MTRCRPWTNKSLIGISMVVAACLPLVCSCGTTAPKFSLYSELPIAVAHESGQIIEDGVLALCFNRLPLNGGKEQAHFSEFSIEHGFVDLQLPDQRFDSLSIWIKKETENWNLIDLYESCPFDEVRRSLESHRPHQSNPIRVGHNNFLISGIVRDEHGDYIDGACVELLAGGYVGRNALGITTKTQREGEFIFEGLNFAEYWVKISKPGFAPIKALASRSMRHEKPVINELVIVPAKKVNWSVGHLDPQATWILELEYYSGSSGEPSTWAWEVAGSDSCGCFEAPQGGSCVVTLNKSSEIGVFEEIEKKEVLAEEFEVSIRAH